MPLVINGLNIPETLGNVKVNGDNITTVNINGSTVWQVSTSMTTYIIQNGTSNYNPSNFLKAHSTELSSLITYTVYDNGSKVIHKNDHQTRDGDICIKFPSVVNFSGQTLSVYANLDLTSGTASSSYSLYLAIFDSSNNIISSKWIQGCGVDYELHGEHEIANGSMTLPTSGSGYIGYIISCGGSKGAEFTTKITTLSITT